MAMPLSAAFIGTAPLPHSQMQQSELMELKQQALFLTINPGLHTNKSSVHNHLGREFSKKLSR
jgi:hypothetical protein